MAKFLRSDQKAKTLIRKNGELLATNDRLLFGQSFYSYLHQKAKASKAMLEIKQSFAPRRPSGRGRQPFRRPPPPQTTSHRGGEGGKRGGFRRFTRGGGQGAKRGRYVRFTSKSNKHKTVNHDRVGKHPDRGPPTISSTTRSCGTRDHCSQTTLAFGKNAGTRGQVTTLSGQLAETDQRSNCTRSGDRLPNSMAQKACANPSSFSDKVLQTGKPRNSETDTRNAEQSSGERSRITPTAISEQFISQAEEGWVVQTCIQSKETEFVHTIRAFQDGNISDVVTDHPTQGLDGENRPERRLLLCTNSQTMSEFPQVSQGEQEMK